MDLMKDLSKRLIKPHYLNTLIEALLLASAAVVFSEFSDTVLSGHKLTLRAKSANLGASTQQAPPLPFQQEVHGREWYFQCI